MKTFWIQITILCAIIFGALYMGFNQNSYEGLLPNSPMMEQRQIKVGDTLIKVEVADTTAKRSRGLSGRESLEPDSGMLFIFSELKKYQFWMKGMKFPIDMVFISNGKVVDILQNVPPPVPNTADKDLPTYQSVTEMDMMLEIPAGYVQSRNIKIGDTVYLIAKQEGLPLIQQ